MSAAHIPADVRRLVRDRAHEACEYCLLPEQFSFNTHHVDHIIAQKHGGQTTEENLALSFILCNQAKGSDLSSIDPLDGRLTALFHPRLDAWSEHFELRGGFIKGKTATGRVTANLLQLNAPEKVEERRWLIEAGVLITAPR
ncbi:MAG TPA: HNH endonuclease [Verrucomicrobiales bacterium]|nr:HNH endonuclease [Verrucomicrobiales bacterium]